MKQSVGHQTGVWGGLTSNRLEDGVKAPSAISAGGKVVEEGHKARSHGVQRAKGLELFLKNVQGKPRIRQWIVDMPSRETAIVVVLNEPVIGLFWKG